jgi:hypothetical protein
MGNDLAIALHSIGDGFGLAAGPGSYRSGNNLLHNGPVHRQAVDGHFGAEQLGRRFGASGRFGLGPAGQRLLLKPGHLRCQFRPPLQPRRRSRPIAIDPFRSQVAFGVYRILGIGVGPAKEVGRCSLGHRFDRQPVQLGPHPTRIGPPPAEDEPVHGCDVPTGRDPHARPHHDLGRGVGPQHPPGPDGFIDKADDGDGIAGLERERPAAGSERQAEPDARSDGQADELASSGAGLAQLVEDGASRRGHTKHLATWTGRNLWVCAETSRRFEV